MFNQPLDVLPIWLIYLLTVIILFMAVEAGFRLGKHVQKRWPDRAEAGFDPLVGAVLVLSSFLLAFVTSISMANFNQRRHLVVLKANAIRTLPAGRLSGRPCWDVVARAPT